VVLKGLHFFPLPLFFVLLLGSGKAFSQSQSQFKKDGDESKTVKRKGQNLVGYDYKRLHYGFFLALNRSGFRTYSSPYFNSQLEDKSLDSSNRLYSINPQSSAGFTTGFILNIRIFDLLDVRVLPTVSFYQRSILFRYQNDSTTRELNQSTFSFMELPILVKFKSLRRNNTRMYMIAGIKPAIEVGSKKKEIQEDRLRATGFDFNIEYGFGFDFYYPLFKFSPEIRFSHGFSNLRNVDPNAYSRSISKMYTHTVTLYFNFE
jgi:hypothetical protein